jgi:hypothetical protein
VIGRFANQMVTEQVGQWPAKNCMPVTADVRSSLRIGITSAMSCTSAKGQ